MRAEPPPAATQRGGLGVESQSEIKVRKTSDVEANARWQFLELLSTGLFLLSEDPEKEPHPPYR